MLVLSKAPFGYYLHTLKHPNIIIAVYDDITEAVNDLQDRKNNGEIAGDIILDL